MGIKKEIALCTETNRIIYKKGDKFFEEDITQHIFDMITVIEEANDVILEIEIVGEVRDETRNA